MSEAKIDRIGRRNREFHSDSRGLQYPTLNNKLNNQMEDKVRRWNTRTAH